MIVFWQRRDWADRIVFLEWENTHIFQISSDYRTIEYGSKEEIPPLQYNLDGKSQKKYRKGKEAQGGPVQRRTSRATMKLPPICMEGVGTRAEI